MAEWKKVAVSGSSISQFTNDVGYITSSAGGFGNAFTTMSVNGVDLLADNDNDTLTLVTGSLGSGLTISGSAANDTITFSLGNIPNSTLASSSITLGNTTINLGDTVTQVDGLNATGSFTGSFTGVADLPDLTAGLAIVPFTYDGSGTAQVEVSGAIDLIDNRAVRWDDTNGKFVNTNITDNDTLVTVAIDALFQGDITVLGTASFQESENLLVADRFALFASGSTIVGDGGIIVQQGTQDVGKVFGYDSTRNRWGFSSSFSATSNDLVPDVLVGQVQTGTGQAANSPAPIYGGATNGFGTIHVDTDDGDIWIYA